MTLGQFFHVGIVVPDIVAARARITELLGSEWGPVMDNDIEVRDADGHEVKLPNKVCYSTQPPHIELILEVPGTPWVCNDHSNLHHIGFFSGTLDAESGRLDAAGCPLEIMGGHGSSRPSGWAYHRDLLGVRVELVDEALRVPMEGYLFRPSAD
jgi:hypothetical protein